MFSGQNLIKILVNTLIGGLLVFLWLKLVNLNEVLGVLSQVNYLMAIPFILVLLAATLLRALRLKILLGEYQIPYRNIVFMNLLAQLLSFTIPIRLGEISKGVYLSTQYNLPTAKSIIWIFLDRALDFWLYLILSFVLLIFVPTSLPGNFKLSLMVLMAVFTLGVFLLVWLPGLTKRIVNIAGALLIFPKMKRLFIRFSTFLIDTSSLLRKGVKESSAIFSLTLLAIIVEGSGWFILFSTVLKEPVNFLKVLLGSLLAGFTYLIPAAPGYVGSTEASTLAVFSFGLGFDKVATSAVAILFHVLVLLYLLIFGLLALYMLKFDLKLVLSKLRR